MDAEKIVERGARRFPAPVRALVHEHAEEVPCVRAELEQALPAEGRDLAVAVENLQHVFTVLRQSSHFTRVIFANVNALFAADMDLDGVLADEERGRRTETCCGGGVGRTEEG